MTTHIEELKAAIARCSNAEEVEGVLDAIVERFGDGERWAHPAGAGLFPHAHIWETDEIRVTSLVGAGGIAEFGISDDVDVRVFGGFWETIDRAEFLGALDERKLPEPTKDDLEKHAMTPNQQVTFIGHQLEVLGKVHGWVPECERFIENAPEGPIVGYSWLLRKVFDDDTFKQVSIHHLTGSSKFDLTLVLDFCIVEEETVTSAVDALTLVRQWIGG